MNKNRFELFVSLTGSAMKSIQRIKTRKMRKYGLTSAHTNCICRLESAGERGLTQMEIVRQEMMDASQISRVLRELQNKGYVKVNGAVGRYRRRYVLTESGMVVAQEIRNIIQEINGFVSGGIPREDVQVFYRTLHTICESLAEAEKVYTDEDGTEE